MNNKTILIPLETSSRELTYKIFLCNYLSDVGFECFLGAKSAILNQIKSKQNFIYIDKGYHKDVSEKIYKIIKENNGLIVNLDEEGAVAFPDGSPLHLRYSKKALSFFDLTFFWGTSQKKMFEKLIPKKNIAVISGHPRFNLLKQKYNYLYEKNVNEIKSKYGKFILINTNFARANNIRGLENARKNYIGRYKNIDLRINNDIIKLKIFFSLIKKLADLKYNIVIRPHPEEKISTYKDKFRDYSNIFVTNKSSSIPWILASETLIHSDCTTAIESLMLGKKPISYISKNLDQSVLTILPQKASYVFENENKILEFIRNKKFKKTVDLSEYNWLETYFNYSKNPFEIIIHNLSKLNLKASNPKINLFPFRIIINKLKKKINLLFGRKDHLNQQKLQDFTIDNLKSINNLILKNNKKLNSVLIKKISSDLFLFKKTSPKNL